LDFYRLPKLRQVAVGKTIRIYRVNEPPR